MEIIKFADAYASLGDAIQQQLKDFLDMGTINAKEEGNTITAGAYYYIDERIISPFRDSENEEIQEMVTLLEEARGELVGG